MTVDLVLKLLERVNNEVEHWGFAKDHHGHVAVVFSQSCKMLGSGDFASVIPVLLFRSWPRHWGKTVV